MGAHARTRRNGASALPVDGCPLVAVHQPVPRYMGTECLPADRSALRGLRDRRRLSKNWGRQTEELNMRILTAVLVALAMIPAPAFAQAAAKPKTPAPPAAAAPKSPGAGPVFVVETMKGTVEIETYPNEAPKTV